MPNQEKNHYLQGPNSVFYTDNLETMPLCVIVGNQEKHATSIYLKNTDVAIYTIHTVPRYMKVHLDIYLSLENSKHFNVGMSLISPNIK